jgi:hypothetical protein
MFCPSCGFEYTQKTNYCKRCGESLSVPAGADAPKMQRSKVAGMFWAIAVFCLLGLVTVFNTYDHLVGRGVHDNELMWPFVAGLFFVGAVALLLIWQLARMITVHQKTGQNVIVEKHFIREAPPAQLGAPTDPLQQTVEPPSVVEHTTRQMAGKNK